MDRTRYVTVLAACFICMFTWSFVVAGGPPGAPGGSAAPPAGPAPGPGAPPGEAAPSNFGVGLSGGVGGANMGGGFPGSPDLAFTSSGFAYNLRATVDSAALYFPFAVYGDFYRSQMSGSATASTNTGGVHPIAVGDSLWREEDLNLWAVTGDFDLTAPTGLASSMGSGLRLQYANMQRKGVDQNLSEPWSDSINKNYGMFGIGGFLVIKPGNLLGNKFASPVGSINPVLKLAGALGKGSNGRYWEAEALLDILQLKGGTSDWLPSSFTTPSVLAQFGYFYWQFSETTDHPLDLLAVGLTPYGSVETRFHIGYWMARAAVNF